LALAGETGQFVRGPKSKSQSARLVQRSCTSRCAMPRCGAASR